MDSQRALLVALLVLILVWAYGRQRFEQWLGLATPHGEVEAGPDTPIVHTGRRYGTLLDDPVRETGPATGATGTAAAMVLVRNPWRIG